MLHNLMVYIQGSIQREQKFWELSSDLRLSQNNDTRWNSWFTMIKTVINLREALDEFCDVHAEESMYSDILSSND